MVKLVNRAKMKVASGGAGTLTLGLACDGYQTFAAGGVTDQDKLRYTITDGNDWEIGVGTYTASGTTLARAPTESSNSGNAITCGSGAEIFVTMAAEDFTGNAAPRWTTTPPSSLEFTPGLTSTITGVAVDEGGFPIQYSWDGYKDSTVYSPTNLPAQLTTAPTFNSTTKTWTLTPSTSSANSGSFVFRSRASDGANTITSSTSTILSFMYTTGLIGWYDANTYVSGSSTWSDKSGNSGPNLLVNTSNIDYVASSTGGLPTLDIKNQFAITVDYDFGSDCTIVFIFHGYGGFANTGSSQYFGGSHDNAAGGRMFTGHATNTTYNANNVGDVLTSSSKLYYNKVEKNISSVASGGLSRSAWSALVHTTMMNTFIVTGTDPAEGWSSGGYTPSNWTPYKLRAVLFYDHEVSAINRALIHNYYKADYPSDTDMAP